MTIRPPAATVDRAIETALALRDAGRGDEALAAIGAAIFLHPSEARLWQARGTIYRALEQSAQAIDAFARASALMPRDVRARYGVAQASLEAGRPATALFDRLQALAPTDGSIALGRSAAQLAEGQGNAAVADLDRIVAANPLWLEGQAALARLRWQLGDAAGFATGYRRASTAHPQQPALWVGLIDLLHSIDQFDAAAEVLAQARAATGGADALLPFEAKQAAETGDVARADAAFAALANNLDIGIVEQHARHLLRAGRPDAAARRVEPWLGDAQANRLWPYASLAWRLTGDHRSAWLEGDPALVGVHDLGLSSTEIADMAERLRTLHVAKRDPLGQSVRGGTQTDGPLFAHEAPEIQRLRAAVVEAVTRHTATLGLPDPTHPTLRHVGKRFRFAGSWSVRLTGEGHHSSHIHPQGWLSSACYIALPTQDAMGPEPAGWLQLGQPPASLGLDLPPYRVIAPQPGRLVLFPSTMWHGTAPITGGERLSVAFDVAAIS